MVVLLVVRSQVLSAHRGTASDAARALLRRAVTDTAAYPSPLCGSGRCATGAAALRTAGHTSGPPRGGSLRTSSLSRCEGLAVVAVTDAGPVGVDVEPVDAARFAGFDDVALHAAERMTAIAGRTRTWSG